MNHVLYRHFSVISKFKDCITFPTIQLEIHSWESFEFHRKKTSYPTAVTLSNLDYHDVVELASPFHLLGRYSGRRLRLQPIELREKCCQMHSY